MGRKKQRVTVGHEYSLGMHAVVGHANMDAIERIRVGEKVAWTPTGVHPDEVIKDSLLTGEDNSAYASSIRYDAQTFTVSGQGYYTSGVRLKIYRDVGYSATTVVAIQAVTAAGLPDDSDVKGSSTAVVASEIVTDTAGGWVWFIFATQIYLETDTQYAIVLKPNGANVYWRYDSANGYANGSLYLRNVTWGISTGNDALFAVYLSEGNSPNHTVTVTNADLFGGNRKEGGVRGNIDILFGASDQTRNTYLVSKLDANIPAFRGLTSLILNQVYVGTSPYIKLWAFFCRRLLKQVNGDTQWYIAKAVINAGTAAGDDLNAIHIIRECLIDSEWGLGFETSDIDSTSFEIAADILYDESFGLSLVWDQIESIEDFVSGILRAIAGYLYQDLSTGKWTITLTRDTNLPLIDESTEYPGIIASGNPTLISFQAGVDPEEQQRGQTFTPTNTFATSRIALKLGSDDSVTVRVEVQSTTAGLPNGNVLAFGSVEGSDMLAVDDLLTDDLGWITAILNREIVLLDGTQYAIVFYITTPGVATVINYETSVYTVTSGPPYAYTGGTRVDSSNFGVSWTIPSSGRSDLFFRVLSVDPETFDENHIMVIEDFARPAYGEIINQVVVNWWDKVADKTRPAMAQDIALIGKQNNNIIELNLNHYGICNADLANQVAERELKLASSMLASMRLKCTRRMSHLKPNDVFKLSWSELGIVQMIVRVLDVNYGSLQKNEIYITCIEDAFSTAATVFADPPDTEWIDPVNAALDVVNIDLIEIPYWILINEIENQSVVDAYDNDAGFMLLATAPPTSDALDYEYLIQHAAGLGFNSEGTGAFIPNATLEIDVYMESSNLVIDIDNIYGLNTVLDGSYAIINTEIVQIVSVDTDNEQVTIARGLFDTVPEAHSSGDIIYFIGTNYLNVETEYTNGDQPQVKILTRTATGQLVEASATTQTIEAMDSRAIRPYPPGDLKFNTVSFPTFLSTAITGGFEITWAHRDRTHATQVGTQVLHTDSTDYGPEATVTYTIKVYDEDNNLARTVTGLAGVAYEYTEAFEIADSGVLQKQLRFVIYAVRGGYDSWQTGYDITIKRTPIGSVSAVSSTTSYLTGGSTKLDGSAGATSTTTSALTIT